MHVPLYTGSVDADLKTVSVNKLAEKITGGLSITSKMPCPSWGLPATRCKIGSVLARKEGTVCHSCYARKGRYAFPAVQRKLQKRYRGIFHELWTPSMIFLIRWYAERYFRWFDSGDVQGVNHLRNICTIAEHTNVRHWLPTREIKTARAVRPPENLVIRVSACEIDGEPQDFEHTSGVVTQGATCLAQDGCGSCRMCWDRAVKHVSYRLH